MSGGSVAPIIERRTICFPNRATRGVLQHGDSGFRAESARLYSATESNATERLIALKARLHALSSEEFFPALTEGLADLLGAEMAFVMKRVLVDDQNAAVEMPPYGTPGSCMAAVALHYRTSDGTKETLKETKFQAYGSPCGYMRHDKVFLIPDDLGGFITDNPNQLPTPADAYLAVPLFAEGKCIAHIGLIWSKQSAAQLMLSWAFVEILLHSVEDIVCERLVEGTNFFHRPSAPGKPRVIPHDAVTIAQSLRPYAGSLSHELRTPMQGVVGMLDVMYATVQEAVEGQTDSNLRRIFEKLRDDIEVTQDSSRRAVEAADNVVHAYDMDMSVLEGPPMVPLDDPGDIVTPLSSSTDKRPEILIAGSNLPVSRPKKRRREEATLSPDSESITAKSRRVEDAPATGQTFGSDDMLSMRGDKTSVKAQDQTSAVKPDLRPIADDRQPAVNTHASARTIAPGLRHTNMREVIQYVISEGLKIGGRPDSATAQETELGELIEVRSVGSDGRATSKVIEWTVTPGVPETLYTEEKDLCKLITSVFLNAVKFTDDVGGRIGIHAKMSAKGRVIVVTVVDNGPGIPAAFLPKLFKPFSQENGSLTRHNEGLGLGLMVAKGIARRLGGDLLCTRVKTEGPDHGTEFEIRLPVMAGETISRPSSPFNSPMPGEISPPTSETPPLSSIHQSGPGGTDLVYSSSCREHLLCNEPIEPRAQLPRSEFERKSVMLNVTETKRSQSPTSMPISSPPSTTPSRRKSKLRKSVDSPQIDRELAQKYPLNFLVVEDNKINRKLLVNMLSKFGYTKIHEAHDGAEAVRQMSTPRAPVDQIDVVLMDLWMPLMDGYEAAERILNMKSIQRPTVLAVTADVTEGALERAAQVGMTGFMSKPFKMLDLQRLIQEYCARSKVEGQTVDTAS